MNFSPYYMKDLAWGDFMQVEGHAKHTYNRSDIYDLVGDVTGTICFLTKKDLCI